MTEAATQLIRAFSSVGVALSTSRATGNAGTACANEVVYFT